MARSHHRKKHKEHLRNYQQSQEGGRTGIKKGKVAGIFTVLGAALGFAILFFATGSPVWITIGIIAGGIIGYLMGRNFDKP